MKLALEQAVKAFAIHEIPIGAVLVGENGHILASAYNQTITRTDPTAHAEILALREAAHAVSNYRLLNTTLYVTIEPCLMCMGALVHARVANLVFGASDLKWGACGSLYDFSQDHRLNHRIEVVRGICEADCRELMQAFFRSRRKSV